MSLELQKVRHQSCGKLDALSISRNCIGFFELPTCQCVNRTGCSFRQAMIAAGTLNDHFDVLFAVG
jgi:hypothetical protein